VTARLRDEKRSAGDRCAGEHSRQLQVPGPRARRSAESAALTLPPLGRTTPFPRRPAAQTAGRHRRLPMRRIHWRALAGYRRKRRHPHLQIEIRGEHETAWKPLHENLQERYYSWDSTAYPDGKYRVRVTASDCSGEHTRAVSHQFARKRTVSDRQYGSRDKRADRCGTDRKNRRALPRQGRAERARQGEYSVNAATESSGAHTLLTDSQNTITASR